MILPIYTYGQPVLRKVAEDITPDYPDVPALITDMFATLDRSGGIGLAAPQIGRPVRVSVIDLTPLAADQPAFADIRRAYINPHIIETGGDMETMEEGCLSLPGIHEKVKRPTRVRVHYQDTDFAEHDEWVDGYLARVMQHEFDHLDGKMFIDRIAPLRRQMIKGKLADLLRGRIDCDYKVKPVK